jgi:hypothetical protein
MVGVWSLHGLTRRYPMYTLASCPDVINSLDIMERITDLETQSNERILTDAEHQELELLIHVHRVGEALTSHWEEGVVLVHDFYFSEYARQQIEHEYILHVPSFIHIDWEETAFQYQEGWVDIDIGTDTYWVR